MLEKPVSNPSFQVDALDGLRGMAALIVVFSHTSNQGMYLLPHLNLHGIGKAGVFLFFLLSAYLLSLPLLAQGRTLLSKQVMAHYWQRRFFRIYPLYSLYLLVAVASTWAAAHWLGKQNWGLPFALDWRGFWEHLALVAGKGVTWSIAVEFKFYFILPPIVFGMVLLRSLGKWLPPCALMMAIAAFQAWLPQHQTVVNDIRLTAYISIFLVGVLLAYMQFEYGVLIKRLAQSVYMHLIAAIGLIGIVLMSPLGYSIFVAEVPKTHFHQWFLQYTAVWACILFCCVNGYPLLSKFFSLRLMRFFGAISFSLYLFHFPILIVAEYLHLGGALGAWVVLTVSTLCAWGSFVFFERPLAKLNLNRGSGITMPSRT